MANLTVSANIDALLAALTYADVRVLLGLAATADAASLTSGTVAIARLVNTQVVGDANATLTALVRDVLLGSPLTGARSYNLPLANTYPAGARVSFTDMMGTLTATNTATLLPAGSDTINLLGSLVLSTPNASPILISDGVSKWNVDIRGVSRGGTGSPNAAGARTNLGLGTTNSPTFAGAFFPDYGFIKFGGTGAADFSNYSFTGGYGATSINGPGLYGQVSIGINGAQKWILEYGGRLCAGGTTSSFPSLKRNGTSIEIRLADDSGFGGLATGTLALTGDMSLGKTVTTAGTTGAQSISKTTGRVNFAAAAVSLVVTNALCTVNSIIECTIATNDSTAAAVKAVAGAGSFTIYLGTAPTAETAVNFTLTN